MQKGMYDEHECETCGKENETQKHILECEEVIKNDKSETNIPNKYENLERTSLK